MSPQPFLKRWVSRNMYSNGIDDRQLQIKGGNYEYETDILWESPIILLKKNTGFGTLLGWIVVGSRSDAFQHVCPIYRYLLG